jgi:hypothetical protein
MCRAEPRTPRVVSSRSAGPMRAVVVITAALLRQSGSSSACLEHIDSDQSQRRPRGVLRLSGHGEPHPKPRRDPPLWEAGMKRIGVAVDMSEPSLRAMDLAADLAARYEAELLLLTVGHEISGPDLGMAAYARMEPIQEPVRTCCLGALRRRSSPWRTARFWSCIECRRTRMEAGCE